MKFNGRKFYLSPVFFILFSCLLRAGSFNNLLLDYDEWTYWEIAKQWISGKTLYKDLMDLKAPGIFMQFVLLIKCSSGSMIWSRVFAAALLGMAAFSLAGIGKKYLGANPLLTGMLFLLHFNFKMGHALNTELFYISWTAIGAGLFFLNKSILLRSAGLLCMGFAFSVKVFAATDILCFFFLSAIHRSEQESKLGLNAIKMLLPGIFTLFPFILVHLWFYHSGNWTYFTEAVYEMPKRYAAEANHQNQIDLLALYHFRYLWIVIPAYIGLARIRKIHIGYSFLFGCLLLLNWYLMILPSRLHEHYWLQLSTTMSLLASYGLTRLEILKKPVTQKLWPYGAALFIICTFFIQSNRSRSVNSSLYAVNKLIPELNHSQVLWVANGPALFYHLQKKNCPGRYVHGSLSFDPRHRNAYGIDPVKYWNEQMKISDCIVCVHGSHISNEFTDLLRTNFRQTAEFNHSYSIWIKRSEN